MYECGALKPVKSHCKKGNEEEGRKLEGEPNRHIKYAFMEMPQ
jgi:hypothetical protein